MKDITAQHDPGVITFFIPCLNEAGNIGLAIERITGVMQELGGEYEVLIVDDGSTDESVGEIERFSDKNPMVDIKIVRNLYCRGLGRNYFVAAQRARGEYFMLVNGDAAEPIESIKEIVRLKGKADAIIPYFGKNENRTLVRRLLSLSFTSLVNLISGNRIRYYNGPVLHKTNNVRAWFAETAGFGYQAELLCRLLSEKITVEHVQIANSDREQGASKAFRFTNILSVLNSIFHIFIRRFERLFFNVLKKKGAKTAESQ